MTHDNTYELIKAEVLAGKSGYAASQKYGVDSLKYAKRLSTDNDIVNAKAEGTVKDRAKWKRSPDHYRHLPHVIDVLENGMTQTAAAAKHGVSQPLVNRHVKQALDGQPKPTTNDAPNPTIHEHLNDAINSLKAAAQAATQAGLSPTVIIKVVSEAL